MSSLQHFDGQYSGAALHSFILGLGHSEALVQRILGQHRLQSIDPDTWYDLNIARSIYTMVAEQVGARSLKAVGQKMIEAAPFPPEVKDVRSVLTALNSAYQMNVRGPNIGKIASEFGEDREATVTFSTPFPCALNVGIIQGCCEKFGARPLIEHAPGGCMDRGAASCSYRVGW